MVRDRHPACYACDRKPARRGSLFCTMRCAALWADELAAGNNHVFCPLSKNWEDESIDNLCGGCRQPLDSPGHISGADRVWGDE